MQSLREKQSLFAKNIALLITFAYTHPDVALTFGDFSRMDRNGHSEGSMHYLRLAADMNLFIKGPNPNLEGGFLWKYITGDHPMWHILGDKWKDLDPLNRWGGDFDARDYNHFSMAEGGKA